jgi:[citrate (pro-3S)-lyase] ligase
MRVEVLGARDVESARAFLEEQGLGFEPGFDDLVGVFSGVTGGGRLAGVGARQGDVLKMIAVAPSRQGTYVLGAIVTQLVARAFTAGHRSLFVFTTPAHAASFESLGFELLASHGRAALLENGHGLREWLGGHRALVREGSNGAVVVNCNPFTLGHRHLVEEAARRADTLYVLVVREDRSAFPFGVRLRLVQDGTRDLPNVRVLDTGRYAVSAITFPDYFLADSADAALAQMELDVTLFARRLAPFFHVRRRFFGSEPYSATTRRYNETMHRLLPAFGVEAVEVPRAARDGEAISASRVRALLREGRLEGLDALVPPATAAFLRSPAGDAIAERLRAGEGRHA